MLKWESSSTSSAHTHTHTSPLSLIYSNSPLSFSHLLLLIFISLCLPLSPFYHRSLFLYLLFFLFCSALLKSIFLYLPSSQLFSSQPHSLSSAYHHHLSNFCCWQWTVTASHPPPLPFPQPIFFSLQPLPIFLFSNSLVKCCSLDSQNSQFFLALIPSFLYRALAISFQGKGTSPSFLPFCLLEMFLFFYTFLLLLPFHHLNLSIILINYCLIAAAIFLLSSSSCSRWWLMLYLCCRCCWMLWCCDLSHQLNWDDDVAAPPPPHKHTS